MKRVAGTESPLDYPTSAYGHREERWREREEYLEILTCTWAPSSSSLLRFLLLEGDIVVCEMEGMLSLPIRLPHTLAVLAPATRPTLDCGYLESLKGPEGLLGIGVCLVSVSISISCCRCC